MEAVLKEKDLVKAQAEEVVESNKKTIDFMKAAEKHYLSKIIKFYSDLVKHIQEVEPNFSIDRV